MCARVCRDWVIDSVQQHQNPDDQEIDKADQHGRATNVLGAFGQPVVIQRDPVHCCFDRRIDQLDDEKQQNTGDHQRATEHLMLDQKRQRNQHACEQHFLAKSIFIAKGFLQTGTLRISAIVDARFSVIVDGISS